MTLTHDDTDPLKWYRLQEKRWSQLAHEGWLFGLPRFRDGHVGIKISNINSRPRAIYYVPDNLPFREIHTILLERCESHAAKYKFHAAKYKFHAAEHQARNLPDTEKGDCP